MKRIVVLLTFLIVATSFSNISAQRRGFDMDKRIEQLKTELNLTSDQTVKIKSILGNFQDKMKDMRGNRNGDREKMREKMMDMRKELNDKIKAELNEDQIKKFDELQKKEQKNRNRRDR
ncbi:MAG: Spy/CpxP family protein refolding chaperone [Melioribacteraceae bacterium]|nr:Spy/CpxP family protein refolding chaperone [Melioribacteraceae bacterium]